jgi:hypothetical protein
MIYHYHHRCEVSFTAGATADPIDDKTGSIAPTVLLNRNISCEEVIQVLGKGIEAASTRSAPSGQEPSNFTFEPIQQKLTEKKKNAPVPPSPNTLAAALRAAGASAEVASAGIAAGVAVGDAGAGAGAGAGASDNPATPSGNLPSQKKQLFFESKDHKA